MPLGTILKNSAECKSGIIVYDNVVQNTEMQIRKKYSRDTSNLPNDSKTLVYAAEVLWQAEGARLKYDDWVSGDICFSSVGSCIELCIYLNVNSAFIVKNKTTFPNAIIAQSIDRNTWKKN